MERSLHLAESCLLLFASVVLASVLASDKVPVLVWTNDPSVVFPQRLAGHSISRNEFQKSYVDYLTSDNQDNVVLFMQDKLSVSDFTHFSDVYNSNEEKDSFKHVKSLMSEMSSTFLPSVALPSTVLMEVKHMKSRKVKIVHDPNDLVLDSDDGPHLIIVKLSESHHSRKSFSHLDTTIGLMTMQLKALTRPFVAFYTATISSQGSAPQRHLQSRRLMADTEDTMGVFVNVSDAFYLYASNMTISFNGTVLQNMHTMDDMSDCNSTGSCVIVLGFGNISDSDMVVHNPMITLQFNITTGSNYGYWYLAQFLLEYSTKEEQMSFEYSTDFVAATPLGYSYHCTTLPELTSKNESNAPMIQFENFQIQPFIDEAGQFGHYNDCVGFFTVGTWMFLISSVILIAILFFGVIMLLNISTMDRFDDAKGKTITVAVGE